MVKRILSLALTLIAIFSAQAQQPQQPQMTPLPLNPEVKHGVLPNGLTYYILHNEEPKQRANFYIAQKVGSTLETPEQLGLAHFLEHMAFNGTTHYPGKTMLNYLQSKGIRFGADINAYTAFDQTVYNINNVPTNDVALMDSVLLILHDWSGDILLEESEIDAERGVIQEEWRTRNDVQTRMYTSLLPQIFSEYQYQQMPIGKMDIVMNFKPETLRAYYKKWYRPDQQGIVIVGDFDVAEMEKKVISMFSPIVLPENAAERTYPHVSDNDEPIFATYEDPEMRMTMSTLAFKYDKIPNESRNTAEAYIQENIIQALTAMMVNNRLSEYAMNPNCQYAQAGCTFTNFYVAKTKGAFLINVLAKGDYKAANKDAFSIVARALKTGFTPGELERANDALLAMYDKAYNERDKTDSDQRAQELINTFLDNDATPGIELEYELVKNAIQMIPVEVYNEFAKSVLTAKNQVIVVAQPKTESTVVPTKEMMVTSVEEIINADYEPLQEEAMTEPLLRKQPKDGKIKSSKYNNLLGTTEMTLSNGARVIIKPTDFASDEIILTAFKEGGKRTYPESMGTDVQLVGDAYDYSIIGNYDVVKMKRFLSGKHVQLGYGIGNATNYFNGKTTRKDLETLLTLLYGSFTDIRPDEATFKSQLDAFRPNLQNAEKNPEWIFQNRRTMAMYGNNPLMNQLTVKSLDNASYSNMLNIFKESTKNAADYTFIFTGNVDPKTIEPLVQKYIASLPGKKPGKVKAISNVNHVQGKVSEIWQQPMETPGTTVFTLASGNNLEYNIQNSVMLSLVGDILGNIYTETLREEEGGTYGAQVDGAMNPNSGEWNIVYLFQTNKEQQDALIARAQKEMLNLLNNGTDAVNFNKVKEAALKQYENNSRTNYYWDSNLMQYARGWNMISGHRAAIENLTLEQLNNFMKNLYNGNNLIQVVMEGVPANN